MREGLTVYTFPRSLRKKIRTIHGVENLNKRIRRRTRLVAFLHTDSALRLISAAMAEVHDEWLTRRCYLNLESHEKEGSCPATGLGFFVIRLRIL